MTQKISYKLRFFFASVIYSTLLMYVVSGFSILNPRNIGWLSIGDGTMHVSWEFFRHQPLLQFPIGLNPKYGLEISSTMAFDGQLPILSLALHPFSFLLGSPFQYIGLFILVTYVLNFYSATLIFQHFKFGTFETLLSSILLASSPIVLNRIIENTHYSLASAWIIFFAIYLCLKKSTSKFSWAVLSSLTVLIFLYYLPIIVLLFIFTFIAQVRKEIANSFKVIFTLIAIIFFPIFTMWIIGFFGLGVNSSDVGFGLFRSSLSSLFDPSGWSRIVPDLSESFGSYEGFGYVGLPTIVSLIVATLFIRRVKSDQFKELFPILFTGIVLFIFSLSNKVAIFDSELFSYRIPELLHPVTDTFRSSGRFIWLLSFTITIISLVALRKELTKKIFVIFLTLITVLGAVDYYPQLKSQRETKFNFKYQSNLTSRAWGSISECYSNIRVYPPTVSVENYYNFLLVASSQKLGINTGRFGRTNANAISEAYETMHKEFNTGKLQENSFYVFTQADFIIPELVEFQKNLAIQTLGDSSGYGELNGYIFIAPNISNCIGGERIKKQIQRYGISEPRKYMGEKIQFGIGKDTSKYILAGFSALEDWGVWSVDNDSRIILNTSNLEDKTKLIIEARDLSFPQNLFTFSINGIKVDECSFDLNFSTCEIPFAFKNFDERILNLSIIPKIIRSPKDLGLSEDTRNLGLGLKSISIN